MSEERIGEARDFDLWFSFVSFGVRVAVGCNAPEMKRKLRVMVQQAFGESATIFEGRAVKADHTFAFDRVDGQISLFEHGLMRSSGLVEQGGLRLLNSLLRLKVAELSSGRIFIHSGVVGRNGKAILLPGNSFSGKSTLTAELVKNGAEYYSDEYAVIEKDGRVVPFPRHISLRYFGAKRFRNVSATDLGGKKGQKPIPVGLVLFTHFQKQGKWDPEYLTRGAGLLELISNTVTIHKDPSFSLKVLDLMLRNAIMVRSPRGDVKKFAKFLLEFFDNHTILTKVT